MIHLSCGHKTKLKHEKQQLTNYLCIIPGSQCRKCLLKFKWLGDNWPIAIDCCILVI